MLRLLYGFVALVAMSSAARADPSSGTAAIDGTGTTAARDLFVAALEAAQRGHWLEARELYARSYALRPAPTSLYSLAVAERATGELAMSLRNFRAFLALEPNPTTAPFRDPAQRAVDDLERRVARVIVMVTPTTAENVELLLDGQSIRAARGHEADPGVHTVEVSAAGYRSKIVSLRLSSGAQQRMVIDLDPVVGHETEAAYVPPAASFVAIGIGSVLLAAGVTTGVVGVVQASQAETQDEGDASRRVAIVGDVVAATGGLTVALGLIFLIADAVGGGDQTAVTLTPSSAALRFVF